MPIALVRSISLPNLKIYTTLSLLLVSGCFYYAFDVVRTDPHWKLHQNTSLHNAITRSSSATLKQSSSAASDVLTHDELLSSLTSTLAEKNNNKKEVKETSHEKVQESLFNELNQNETSSLINQLKDVIQFMTHEPVCIWVSV
jgi:hypothetical protein